MIISPPFLPPLNPSPATLLDPDPLMTAVDAFESLQGKYPVTYDRRWHGGIHLNAGYRTEPVRAIADGEVVAYRVTQQALPGGEKDVYERPIRDSNNGFVLLKHSTDTGDGRRLTYYSLYMHLMDLTELNKLIIQPAYEEQQEESSPDLLPRWLLNPTPGSELGRVHPGNGLKVRRKDRLGFMGQCQGGCHLHFEIFMTQADFDAYFSATALGVTHPQTPDGTDVWGHSYYVIPGGTMYRSGPPHHFDSGYFPLLHDGHIDPGHTLHVEAYFHRGQRYTRSWLDNGDGVFRPLSEHPHKDPYAGDYEYSLDKRASTLYPDCPSDGYELLRFGRVLSSPATLADPVSSRTAFTAEWAGSQARSERENPCATWVAVMVGPDTWGYIDIHQPAVQKLSDADFPHFMGWRKIEEHNTPFGADDRCSPDALRSCVDDPNPDPHVDASGRCNVTDDVRVHRYAAYQPSRSRLRGLVCKAYSEWDPSQNERNWAFLKNSGECYAEDPAGYEAFMGFIQALNIGAPALPSGEKLWFFHPLQFIRHFRKCAWLSAEEFKQLMPVEVLREQGRIFYERVPQVSFTGLIATDQQGPLNRTFRKYGITTPQRMAAFLGNALQETMWLQTLHEKKTNAWYYPWDGRGFLQLTLVPNYLDYWEFRGRKARVPEAVWASLTRAHTAAQAEHDREVKAYNKAVEAAHRERRPVPPRPPEHPSTHLADSQSGVTPELIEWRRHITGQRLSGEEENLELRVAPADSAGFYWSRKQMAKHADRLVLLERRRVNAYLTQSRNERPVSKIYYHSMNFRDASATVNYPLAVGRPNLTFNGYVARCIPHALALAILGEQRFPDDKGDFVYIFPEGMQRVKS